MIAWLKTKLENKKMTYAVIGTGNIGRGIAQTLAKAGKNVAVAGRTFEDAKALAKELAVVSNRVTPYELATAINEAQIVFLAVPFGAVEDLAKAHDFSDKIVVDVTNPVKEDFSGLSVGFTSSAAEEIAKLLPNARVVKALNTVFAQIYADGLSFGDQKVPAFVAADDEAAKEQVIDLLNAIGFAPENTGPLSNARYLESLGYLNIQFGYMLGKGTQIAPSWLSR
jgi:predicted dinucleotide-binding enzyme